MSGGQLVVIKRSGRDGMRYPLPAGCVTLGRDADCHIRVLLPSSVITNESPTGETLVNGAPVSVLALSHNDVITLGDRSLRWEYYRPADVRVDSSDLPRIVPKGARKRKRNISSRASEAATRRLEPEVKALLEMRHRASVPGTRAERQVAIVQPQRRGESDAETAEVKTKPTSKPASKRGSRGAKTSLSGDLRKSTRGANKSNSTLDASANTSRHATPRKGAKKLTETPKIDSNASSVHNTQKESVIPKSTILKKDNKVSKTPAKKFKPATPRLSARKAASAVSSTKKTLIVKKSPKTATPKPIGKIIKEKTPIASASKNLEPPKTPASTRLSRSLKVTASNAESSKGQTPKTAKVATPKPNKVSLKSETPISRIRSSKITPKARLGLEVPSMVSIDLAEIAAQGTPKRVTPKGPYVHKATPRPKTPYVETSPSIVNLKLERSTRTPRVNPLLRAATTARKPPTPKTASPKKRITVEKIEEPASIDAQKKSALMALTGRSPMKANPSVTPKPSPSFVISKASIKKISPGNKTSKSPQSGRKSSGKLKSMTKTPKLRPGSPREQVRSYKSRSPGEVGAGDASFNNDSVATPRRGSAAKSTSQIVTSPKTHSPRQTGNITCPIITIKSPTPIKSVLKSPSSKSPRKNESIKFDLSNLEKETESLLNSTSPKSQTRRGRSSVTSFETTSEEDLLLRFSDESSDNESPSRKRSKSNDTYASAKSKSPPKYSVSPRKSRGSLLVQKVLQTSEISSPTPSEQSASSYSTTSTLTKSQFDLSSLPKTPKISPKKTPSLPLSSRSTRKTQSYSIVDLVSVDSTQIYTDTSTDYDSTSSVNSNYGTPGNARLSNASRSKSIVNTSLETSTPVNRGRLSTRKALLKSATIASAIKRSQSTPATEQSSHKSTSKKRSISLTVSPQKTNSTRNELIIEDSITSKDTTITPRGTKNLISRSSTNSSILRTSPKTTPQSKKTRESKSIESSQLETFNDTLSSASSKSSRRSSRSAPTPVNTPNLESPNSSRKTSLTKKRSSSLTESASKRKSSKKTTPNFKLTRQCAVDGPSTPENEVSPNEAGTPVLNIQNFLNESQEALKWRTPSVRETVKRFEALKTPQTAKQLEKITRKTLGGIGERILARRSDFEAQSERKAYSDSKKGRGISKKKIDRKINFNSFKKVISRGKTRVSDESSVASDKTDENASRPDNKISITPKTSIQLVPEAVKGKHSTAKKSLSRKSLIDNLNESQEIVKQLFNSPVKRKLSKSMSNYSRSSNEGSYSRSGSRRSTLGKTPNVSFDFDNVMTPHVPTEVFVSPMDTPVPQSPNLVGVKRLYGRNTPKNDLRNVRGVRALLKTPAAKKSPRNDLTNVSGVKDLLGSKKKKNSPKNDLRQVSGVKKLFQSESTKKTRSPKNDLTQVAGVKALFSTTSSKKQKSPKNDLRNISGVKKLLATPRGKQRSPKNDLSNVSGIRSVFRNDKSIANDLNDVSGVAELFKSTSSFSGNTISEFDKLVGHTPVQAYGRAKSLATKKLSPSKGRSTKSMTFELSQDNVEDWLNKEIEKRTSKNVINTDTSLKRGSVSTSQTKSPPKPHKSPPKSPSKSPLKTPKGTESPLKTSNKSIVTFVAKSSKIERALKKLAIDAVGAEVTITPGRSKRSITANKSAYSIEVAKALTPPNKKESISKTSSQRKTLPFKKRILSKTPRGKTPKKDINLNNSTDQSTLDEKRPSLPLKKRMINHTAVGHSTPVKNKSRSRVDETVSEELRHVSPIPLSPNVTPRKSVSLHEAKKLVEKAEEVIRSVQKEAKHPSPENPPKAAKKLTKELKGKSQSTIQTSNHSPEKPIAKTRSKRGIKNDVPSPKVSPKKSARGQRAKVTKAETATIVVSKKAPNMSPQKPSPKATRSRKVVNKSPEKVAPIRKGRKVQNKSQVKKSAPKRASLVITKKAPSMSPQKPIPKTTRSNKVVRTSPKPSPVIVKKGRKVTSPKKASRKINPKVASAVTPSPKKPGKKSSKAITPIKSNKRTTRKEPSPKKKTPVKAGAKKLANNKSAGKTVSPVKKNLSPVEKNPKKTRGRKAAVAESSPSPVQSRKKATVRPTTVPSPPVKTVRGGAKRKAESKPAASPKVKKSKQVRFELEEIASREVGTKSTRGRRKADATAEDESAKPQAKRKRGRNQVTSPAASPVKRRGPQSAKATGAVAKPTARSTQQRK